MIAVGTNKNMKVESTSLTSQMGKLVMDYYLASLILIPLCFIFILLSFILLALKYCS